MPLGPFGEVVGTTGTLDALGSEAQKYKSKVIVPRNPKLLKSDEEDFKMTPSKFMFDMAMDTEQRLANTHCMRIPKKTDLLDMADTSLQKFSQVNIDEPLFQPFPSEIYFQNFQPYEVYEVPFVLRNNDKVPRLVKVTQVDSPYFKIISPHDVGNKVGPGLPTTFRLQFTPEERKDYSHELVCITEREKFVVPVKAIGARAILDFPDDLNFPTGPVKYTNSKTLLIRNIGDREAKFSLSTEKPFSVSPEVGTLSIQESMQVTVEFNPQKAGDHKCELVIHYDTGEDVFVRLYGAAQDVHVRLDKNSLWMENTFISMASQKVIVINNRTDVIAHFRWTQFASQEEEDYQKSRLNHSLQNEEQNDTDRFLQECITDPSLRDKLSILGRTFRNRKMMIDNDKMLFNDEVVKIDPVEGDIWPNSTLEVTVIFKPRDAKTYTRTVFCDVTGRETCLPLRVRGDGIGPKVQFSFETLDMGNIFIGSTHTYEIVMANKGDIDAIYSLLPKSSIFGPCFKFNPAEGIVMPGGHQAIQILFSSPYLGDFEEEFCFQVDGQPEQFSVNFVGSVIGPTFQFDVSRLKFRTVSYGFLNTQACVLTNTSLVPMTFHLHVPGDGATDSICGTSDLDSTSDTITPRPTMVDGPPKEFEIIPASGTLGPQSELKVTVNFISNTIQKYEMALVVDVENVGDEILSLPISAKCIVPAVTILSPVLDYGRCFLRHPYEYCVKLHNDSELPAKYELQQQHLMNETPVIFRSSKRKGVIEPHSVCDVPIIIEAQTLQEQEVVAFFSIFGSPDPPLPVQVMCIGEGPVVHIQPMELDWGLIPVLTDTPKTIRLSNESLIAAKFTAHMVRPKTIFKVVPSDGVIEPEKYVELTVVANLDDSVRFYDKLQINFLESQSRMIPLTAYGHGTTVVSDPPLTPLLDLGANFSNRPLIKTFHLTNRGRRHQQLVWSMDGFSPLTKAKKDIAAYNPLDMKFRNVPPPPDIPKPVFKVNPNRFDMPSGSSIDMHLEGFVETPNFVREKLLCHAIIGRQGGKELIMKVDVSADFVSPLLDFSTKSVYFRIDKLAGDILGPLVRELVISNVSSLPLTTGLKLQYPFQIVLDDNSQTSEMEIQLSIGQKYTLRIQFDPAYKDDMHIRTIDEVLHITYKEHPHIDYIALRGEVYFPNLEFEKHVVDFGCILNDTEVTRYINITNNSPMEVKYKWSFLIGDQPCAVFTHRPKSQLDQMFVSEESDVTAEEAVEVVVEDKDTENIEEEEIEVEPTRKADDLILETEKDDETDKEQDVISNIDNKDMEEGIAIQIFVFDEDYREKGELEQEEPPEGGVDKNQMESLRLSLTSFEDVDMESDGLRTNRALCMLLEQDRELDTPIGIEEVFDILPLYGMLQPGDTEQVTMTFYGHADIWGEAKAICEVEGGPTYDIILKGEASLVDYRFDCKQIDYGKQMFDHTCFVEITLVNSGKVGFDFSALNMDPALANKPRPGLPVMVPHAGYIEPFGKQTLIIKYLPGVPERFEKSFKIQVAHFEPDTIILKGEGVFPRINLDLPRTQDINTKYQDWLKEAKMNLTKKANDEKPEASPSALPILAVSSHRMVNQLLGQGDESRMPSEFDLQMEVERLAVQDFSLDQQQLSSRPDLHVPTPPPSTESRASSKSSDSKSSRKKSKIKAKLPEYLLDFGYVVLGTEVKHIVHATNTGWFPVSFQVEKEDFRHLGFHVELDKIRNLPGAPDNEMQDFKITFDPRGANLQLGPVEALVPINILNGPMVMIRLRACVTMPDMQISDDVLDFGEVKCGECKIIMVQLHNHQQVKCDWNSLPSDKDRKASEKHIPLHLRRKSKQDKLKPRHFDMLPPVGTLLPEQRLNVQVKFMPTEEKYYEQRIPIRIAQSSQRVLLLCRGQGLEPRLEIDRTLVEFGPILPHSCGDEQQIIFRNPCPFPIEFYNLEFDSTYLEEEKVLRLMNGYDEYNTILLPPRRPGDKLPYELTDYYDEQMKKLKESEKIQRDAEEVAESARREQEKDKEGSGEGEGEDSKEQDSDKTDGQGTAVASRAGSVAEPLAEPLEDADARREESEARETSSSIGVGELEITPVSAAIARYLGIDLTPEGKAARNRRGIAVIVHGPPMSGKTSTSVMLARRYEGAILTVDGIVLEALSNGNTLAGMRARELCSEAARRRAEEMRMFEGDDIEKKAAGGLSVEAVAAHTQGTNIKAKERFHGGSIAGTKTGVNTSSVDGATGSQVPSSPPPLAAPIARRLSVSASVAGEEGLMSCVLPDELLVEILAERLQLNDCHRGVVFDGLETLFSQNFYSTANSILKALNNRRFIYFLTLNLEFAVLKVQKKKAREEKVLAAKKAEEEERCRLEDMSEDEYDALTDEGKAEVDKKRLEVKKERIRREMEERLERERLEREAFEAEQKKLEEEKLQKKKGKKQTQQQKEEMKDGKKSVAAGKAAAPGSTERIQKSQGGAKPHDSEHPVKVSSTERPDSHKTDIGEMDKSKRGSKDVKRGDLDKLLKEKGDKSKDGDQVHEEPVKDPVKESEILLIQRFRTFEHAQKDLADMVEFWDRTTVSIKRPVTPSEKSEDDQPHPPSGKKGRGKDKHDKAEKEKQKQLEKENAVKAAREAAQAQQEGDSQEGETTVDGDFDDGIGIPHIVVECVDKMVSPFNAVLESRRLPTMEEVLDGLGLGPQGPPIPPPAALSVVPYPVKRRAPPVSEIGGQYTFVASSPDDPNIGTTDNKDSEQDEEKSATPEKGKEEHTTPTKGKGKDKQKSSGSDGKERKKSAEKRQASKTARRNSMQVPSPPPGANTPGSDTDAQSTAGDGLAIVDSKNPKLSIFRWIVPSNGEVVLHLRFQSEELGQFDQTLNIEIVGTRRRYQLFCRGVCAFPSISREPRIVFQHRKKNRKIEEIVNKKYILTTEIFEFGPLLVGKSREKYKEARYPENMEKFTVQNTSPLEADVNFCFLNDCKGETFILDPPSALLKSGESTDLTVWAYPKVPGHYEDAVVCCIRENPEPVVFKISCDGFRPELELDKKQLHFDRVLLHRKDTKVIYLRNSTQLPVRWKLSGLENLGDDFTVGADSGIVDPKSEYALNAYFRAMKPVQTSKKMIRLEISDAENIMGVVHTEAIQVIAEAYDVALDMSFPKGADGGLDFATVRVMEETKQTCTLKNKGKYEIKYNFFFENVDPSGTEVTSLFTVIPSSGTLTSLDRPTQVQVIFRAKQEVTIKEQPILKCHVIEPNISEGGEIIASIPVKVSVKAVFNKYNILPTSDINFGCLLMNSKKSRTFIVENKGEFDFRYTITKMVKDAGAQATQPRQGRPPVKNDKRSRSRDGSSSGRSVAKPKKTDSLRDAGTSQLRLQLGMFTIFPAFGIILPNGHQTITVDCVAEQQGRFDEELAIDITDRDPNDCPHGIPYKLLAEACVPSINIDDIGSIFEEHKIVKNLSIWQHSNELKLENGVFCEDENKFYFNNVIVGHKAHARFKIANTNKVPCDVVFTVKSVAARGSSKQQQDIFEVEPPRVQIPNHSYAYVVATFTPPSMQSFGAIFEATIEGISQTQSKGRQLVFELAGDGNLPRINITKPLVRNKRGQSLLLFKKNLVGRSESLPLVLHNEGTLPSKVDIDLIDPDHVFSLCPTDDTKAVMHPTIPEGRKLPHTASVIVTVGEKATFDVIFTPHSVQRSQANIRLSVIDNQYEDSIIQLVGEGYEDTITLDNIRSVDMPIDPEKEGSMADDDIQAAKPNLISFGDCYIGEPRTLSFSMMNHSKGDCIRFQWPELAWLKFSPQVGHLHPCSSKDFAITFKADQPRLNIARSDLSKEKSDKSEQAKADLAKPTASGEQQILCKVNRIVFDKPIGQITDWDDRIRTVKWVDVPSSPNSATESSGKAAATATPRPAKKKVVETESEPVYTEVSESSRNVELLVMGTADFCRYKCKTESINFKETLMFQTRIFQFTLGSKGSVKMDYNWQIVMENFSPTINRAVTFISEAERPESCVDVVNTQYVPFTIEPEFGTIEAGKKATFKVKFSPLDVNDYEGRLICTIPNLAKNQQGPVIGLKGRSFMPFCHFELMDSDYITGSRRNPELRGPGGAPPGSTLDSSTRVIEFCCVGIDTKMTKSFSIVNPTSQRYSFQWICEEEMDPKILPSFKCLHPKGVIKSGKKFDVAFEFTATELDIVESFWTFFIPEQNIKVPFVLVGEAKEPSINLDRSHMNFKALLIGHEAVETVYLMNNEDQPFFFSFLEDSCNSAGYSNHLIVHPMFATIPPKSRLPISIYFIPNSDKEVNFNLVCKIKRKIQPLTLNVKAEGYSMNCTVLCEDSQGNRVELSDSGLNQINFGEVEVNEKQIRNIFILNSGKFNFDYKWELNSVYKRKDLITMTPMEGGVMFGEKCKCLMTFCPPCRATLRDCELVLKISHGPSYHIALTGLGVTPGLHFSFHTYNFGNCFIYRAGMPTQSVVLKLTNKDKKEISVDCLYRQTSQLYHDFEACVIPSSGSVDITFSFYPREAIKYHETVTFEINGLSRQKIDLYGHGSEMKIEVQDPKHKIVNLGSKVIGEKVRKLIPIVNSSPAPIAFTIGLTPMLPALQQTKVLTVSPANTITLEPRGGICKVEVMFTPKSRIPQFTEEVMLEIAGLFQPLFVLKGSCLGMEVSLDTNAIPFGAVVQRSRSLRKVVLCNTGDMSTRFRWDIKKFAPDFSIQPVEGSITPGMEVTFDVTFHPRELNQDIRYENLCCFLLDGQHQPVTLTLTGTCTQVPPVKEVQHFSTYVRQKDTKFIQIANRTNQVWYLKPITDGEYWSGPVTIMIEAQQTKPYELTYTPLVMTPENKKHAGSLFFPLPDGTGLLYNLTGTAEPPKPNGKNQHDVPCKTSYTEVMPVFNWLKKPQRFRVKFEPIKPEKLEASTTVKGMEYIDVPASGKKDYKLLFFAHKEGVTILKVTFINEQSGEYQYYELTFRATKPGIISTIELSCPVRQSVPYTVRLENPLPTAATFSGSCSVPEILMPSQMNVVVPAESKSNFALEYQPLRVGEITGRLEFNCNDLGQFIYDLQLKATPAGPEKALYFHVCLGQNQIQMAKFTSFAKQKTDYSCKVDNPDFHVEKSAPAAPGPTEVSLDVTFEPSRLGEQRGTLIVSSQLCGEYIFPLLGTSIPPKPQGPFIVKVGSTTSITFHNVFSTTTAFTFQVDNPLFHITKQSENIRSRKDYRIVVGFDGNDSGSKAAVMGKMIVICPRSAGGNASAQWVYYLKGVTP